MLEQEKYKIEELNDGIKATLSLPLLRQYRFEIISEVVEKCKKIANNKGKSLCRPLDMSDYKQQELIYFFEYKDLE